MLDNSKLPHSGQGITGMALGALGILIFLTIVAIGILYKMNNHLTDNVKSFMVLLLIIDILVFMGGTGLSVKGITNKERAKLFGIVGLVLNLPLLILIMGIIVGWLGRKLF
ncbi:MAG: hypothetical protein WC980_02520 [Candidatus Brocadiia bacterium]